MEDWAAASALARPAANCRTSSSTAQTTPKTQAPMAIQAATGMNRQPIFLEAVIRPTIATPPPSRVARPVISSTSWA